ncbi:hypothetical protein DL93DRAFT_2168164 [Clavulina sp. PMI_390]|nr:hypothetical protein DL93DRAFT_2168164 [Clavulina sp. PMI_390]
MGVLRTWILSIFRIKPRTHSASSDPLTSPSDARSSTVPNPQTTQPDEPTRIPGPDLLSLLPVEILLIIISFTMEGPPQSPFSLEPSPSLVPLSIVNRRLNAVATTLLWRKISIGSPTQNMDGGLMQLSFQGVTRMPERCDALRSLALTLSSDSPRALGGLQPCLQALPNLRSLSLMMVANSGLIDGVCSSVSNILSNVQFPFRLLEFKCNAPLIASRPGINHFFHSQPTIESLVIWKLGYSGWIDHPFANGHRPVFPSLRAFEGPSSFSPVVLDGSRSSIQSVVLNTLHTASDRSTMTQRVDPLVSVNAFSIWSEGHTSELWNGGPGIEKVDLDDGLAKLIPLAYGIDCTSIRSLRIGRTRVGPVTAPSNRLDHFPFSLLEALPSLESLEWPVGTLCHVKDPPGWNSSGLSKEGKTVIGGFLFNNGQRDVERFIVGCEKACPTLHHILLADRMRKRFLELEQKSSTSTNNTHHYDSHPLAPILAGCTPGLVTEPFFVQSHHGLGPTWRGQALLDWEVPFI